MNRRKNIFITGASGFVGVNFMYEASRRGYKFYVLTRNKNRIVGGLKNSIIEIIEDDISNLYKYFSQIEKCSYFLHLAGEKADEGNMQMVNVNCFKNIIDLLQNLKDLKLLYLSSCGVYGIWDRKEEVLSEEMICKPDTPYESTKWEAEKLLMEPNKKLPLQYVILRPSNIFGPHDNANKLINLIKSLKKGRFFYIDNNAMVNYVSVQYVVNSMLYFLENDLFNNEIYNINTPVKLTQFIGIIKIQLGIKKQTKMVSRYLIYPVMIILSLLPKKYQYINKLKYRYLTNKIIYSNQKIKNTFDENEIESLTLGMSALIKYYRSKNLL